MKIKRLQITIEPWYLNEDISTLKVKVFVDGDVHEMNTPFRPDHFDSLFDSLMDDSKIRIKELVRTYALVRSYALDPGAV